jgi:DNA repair protein RadC
MVAVPTPSVTGVTRAVCDDELLALLLGAARARHQAARVIAASLVESAGGLAALSRASPREIAQVRGVSPSSALRIAASFELGRRAVAASAHREVIANAEDLHSLLAPHVAGLAQEVFLVVGIDIRNRMLDIVEIAKGGLHMVEVHPREVFRPLIRMSSAGGLLAHNPPSGDPTPSLEDIALTRRLRDVGAVVGIPIVDHVVLAGGRFCSIADHMGTDL